MESHDLRWLGRLYHPCSEVPDVHVSLSLWNLVCWWWACVPVHGSIIPSGKIEGKGQGADLTGWSNPCYCVCHTTDIRDSCQWPSFIDVQEKAHKILAVFKLCTSSWPKRPRCRSYRFNSIINLEYYFYRWLWFILFIILWIFAWIFFNVVDFDCFWLIHFLMAAKVAVMNNSIIPQKYLFVHKKHSESLHIAMINTQHSQHLFLFVLK